ncbi:MAG: site-specific DNA-methyltransferase [Chloroflexi bacterium]|nr:site-specific DNA-methyltransferase [Chloroflexota bacterium]
MELAYSSLYGSMYRGTVEDFLDSSACKEFAGKVQLIFTSPPFPLNRKKKYGNKAGDEYITWLSGLASKLKKLLKPSGSIVIEIGNAWEPGSPTMSTLALETLLQFKKKARLHLIEQFIAYNPARLPGPAQWVNVERIRVKDAFTHLWWMAPSTKPNANNRNVLVPYSDSMRKLLETGQYNSGKRPSEHHIGENSFKSNNGGAIPSNVLIVSNTSSNDPYQDYCRRNGLLTHPARMPKELPSFFIKFLTEPGDIVLDPFAGSNTTGSVAEVLQRRWVSIEQDSGYVEGSKGRFSPEVKV